MRQHSRNALTRPLTVLAGTIILCCAVAVPAAAQRRAPAPPPPQQPTEPPLLQPPSTPRPAAPPGEPVQSRTPSPAPAVRPMIPASAPPPAPEDSAAATTLRAPRSPEAPLAAPPRPAASARRLSRAETVADIAPPEGARVRCKDGTYLPDEPTATSCTQRGGIAALLAPEPKVAPPAPAGPKAGPTEPRRDAQAGRP